MAQPRRDARLTAALAVVAAAQWLGTSLWFSPAGAAQGLMQRWELGAPQFAWLIAATQLGFIAGSIALAATGAADRWAASRLFALSCVAGAALNALVMLPGLGYGAAWGLRAAVGVTLAGIYPLGMKMVVQWVGGKPALALAWLVGMLTLGTAMPHALRAVGVAWPWQAVLAGSSLMALAGGVMVWCVGDGPHRPAPAAGARFGFDWGALSALARVPAFRASALGYFGHMWELYAFWSVVPLLCAAVLAGGARQGAAWGWLPAIVIGVGSLGCVVGGMLARRWGSAAVAAVALAGSGLVCAVYPLLPGDAVLARCALLAAWGVLVVADSPQFSAMSAQAAPAQGLGVALVLQNGLGFLVSAVSIVLLGWALAAWGDKALWLLLPGPILGLWAMRAQWRALTFQQR